MQTELQAAVQHLRSLLPTSCVDVDSFCRTLEAKLAPRLASSWHVDEPERGSALRAVIWHEHAGGEGYDGVLLSACKAVKVEPACIAPFTMWVDPGCVAVSNGFGPGVSLPSAAESFAAAGERFSSSNSHHSAGLKVIYGSLPLSLQQPRAPARPQHALPQLSVSPSTPAMSRTAPQQPQQPFWGLPPSRSVRIVDPASLLQQRAEPAQASLSLLNAHAASYNPDQPFAEKLGLSRSSSLSSCYRSSASDHCPSLVAGSTTGADSCDGEESGSEISLEDAIGQHGYGIVDLIYQDDVNADNFAELTLQPNEEADTTVDTVVASHAARFSTPVKKRPEAARSAAAPAPPAGSVTPARKAAPTPLRSTPNYTIHDGGNVGVLGGGVKLGGASPVKSPVRASPAPMPHAPLWHAVSRRSSSTTFQQMYNGGAAAPLLAPHSAPIRTVQLPAAAGYFANANPFGPAHHQQLYMHQAQAQAQAQVHAQQQGVEGHMAPPPFHLHPQAHAHQLGASLLSSNAGLSPQHAAFLNVDPSAKALMMAAAAGKRVRSRGRRSRGRGAGRAARRQAAAIKAKTEGSASGASVDDGSDSEDDEDDE